MKVSVNKLDWFLILPFIAGLAMIAEIDPPRETVVAIGPWLQLALAGTLAAMVSLIVAAASALDRRCTEEYVFQILANASLVAFASTMLVHLFWVIGAKTLNLPDPSGENVVGIITVAWATSYYWFRAKGLAQ